VVVDYKLISGAPPRLNHAGYADLLAHATALADWRLGAEAGLLQMDEHRFDEMQAHMEAALGIAGEVASGSQAGILTLMQLFEESSAIVGEHPTLPIGAGSEHLLAWHLEAKTSRHFIHGEVVALGIVVADYLQSNNQSKLKDALDVAQVRYRLPDLDITWEDLTGALASVADYNHKVRHYCSVFDRVVWTPEMLGELRQHVI
jgi:glycerol-1-phosphate dehydrogenase [NAD(P)+]